MLLSAKLSHFISLDDNDILKHFKDSPKCLLFFGPIIAKEGKFWLITHAKAISLTLHLNFFERSLALFFLSRFSLLKKHSFNF